MGYLLYICLFPLQEPPFLNFLSNLSPLKPVKVVRYTQRLLDANFPPPPPVFTAPRIDMQGEPNFLKRDETNDAGSDVYGQFKKSVLNTGMIRCSEKEVQSSIPSGHVDDYFADPMEGEDCMNSVELHSRQANDASQALQRGFTGSKEMVTKFINGTHEKIAELGSSMSLASLDQADKDRPGNALGLVELAGNQRDAERFDEFTQFISEKVVDLASEAQHCEQIVAHVNIAGSRPDEWGCTSQSFSKSLQFVEAYEDSGESLRPVPQGSVENLRLFEQHSNPLAGGMSDSENAGRNKELNQVSSSKKRRRGPNTSDSEGCKHCNCKRSKCLKLYCECFAEGVYCADSCACENCFNKPEYEDKVLDMRQQIESRNPLAFAPKIMKLGTDSPAIVVDDGNRATPSSGRHKRGCNCKKSMCLKKYCECYQSKVGCSDGCRCEGCKNSFGTKAERMYRKAGRWEGLSQEKLEIADIGPASVDKLKSSFPPTSRYLSPESVSLDREWDGSEVREGDLFSPTWEGLSDFSHFTPISHPYPGTVASLDASSSRDFPEISRTSLHQRNNFQSSTGSLHWCNSSISLMPQPSGSKAAHELSSDSALYDLVKDDDIPEILKDSTTPTKAVKVCSPNKKRVSSPHIQLQERSSSSLGLTIGRKFILQGVPSFPPLTPYSNLKNGVNQYRSDTKGSPGDQ